jgi:hypothetical protein
MALVGFVCVACGFVAGYRANDKPARTIIKPEKVWRFVERCPDNPYKAPDQRRFAPQTIPRTNPGAVDLLHAPDYAEHKHGRGRQYEKKGYSRGRPRNSQSGTSAGGVISR